MILIQITEVSDDTNTVVDARVLHIDDMRQHPYESREQIDDFLERALPDIFNGD
jgi:hypothetical protein